MVPANQTRSSIVNTTVNMSGDVRELSLDEVDAVAGGLKFSIPGVLTIAIAEEGVTGISVGGFMGVAVTDGQVCGFFGPYGGCI
jgi:hypothetical protein